MFSNEGKEERTGIDRESKEGMGVRGNEEEE